MLHVMDGGRASPLYRHPVREVVEDYTVNRVYRISRIGLYRVCRVYRVYRIRLHAPVLSESVGEMMSTTIPAATPNPNITVRNLQSDIRDSSTFSSIHEVDIGDQQAMNEYEWVYSDESDWGYERSDTWVWSTFNKRDCTSAVAGTAQGNIESAWYSRIASFVASVTLIWIHSFIACWSPISTSWIELNVEESCMSDWRFLTVIFGFGVAAGIVVDIISPTDSESTDAIVLSDAFPSLNYWRASLDWFLDVDEFEGDDRWSGRGWLRDWFEKLFMSLRCCTENPNSFLLLTTPVGRPVVLYCTYSTYVPHSLSPYRVLNSDTASAFTSFSRHIVISLLSVVGYPLAC